MIRVFRLTNLFYIAIADFISTPQNLFRMIMFSYAIALCLSSMIIVFFWNLQNLHESFLQDSPTP